MTTALMKMLSDFMFKAQVSRIYSHISVYHMTHIMFDVFAISGLQATV